MDTTIETTNSFKRFKDNEGISIHQLIVMLAALPPNEKEGVKARWRARMKEDKTKENILKV